MAKYINIKNNTIKSGTQIAIDTQVVYWFFYAPNTPCSYDAKKIECYSPFMENIVKNGNIVVTSNVLNELFKIIEINEYKLYLEINGLSESDKTLKEYRKIESERESVKQTLKVVFDQIRAIATIENDCNSNHISDQFISEFDVHKADYVDYNLVRYCEVSGIKNLLTDDADFKTIHNSLNIYSGNNKFFSR